MVAQRRCTNVPSSQICCTLKYNRFRLRDFQSTRVPPHQIGTRGTSFQRLFTHVMYSDKCTSCALTYSQYCTCLQVPNWRQTAVAALMLKPLKCRRVVGLGLPSTLTNARACKAAACARTSMPAGLAQVCPSFFFTCRYTHRGFSVKPARSLGIA